MCRDPPSLSLINHFLAENLNFEAFLWKRRVSTSVQPFPKYHQVFPVSVLVFLWWTQFWISSSSTLFSHKASGSQMLLVAKEVSFPEFANCPVLLKRVLYGFGTSLIFTYRGPPRTWMLANRSTQSKSQDPLKQIGTISCPKFCIQITSLLASSLTLPY